MDPLTQYHEALHPCSDRRLRIVLLTQWCHAKSYLHVYTGESIASTFFITAATFGAMAAFGYFTKRDLSKMGSYLYMALIGLIIATLVNLFLKSDTLMWIISYVGVLMFVGITAYDTQMIKSLVAESIVMKTRTEEDCPPRCTPSVPRLHQPLPLPAPHPRQTQLSSRRDHNIEGGLPDG